MSCIRPVAAMLASLSLAATFPGTAHALGEARAELAASDLTYPLFVAAPDGDPRLFVVERAGRIRIAHGGATLPAPFLDIRDRVTTVGEGGLLGLAFPPDYAQSGLFYVYYTNLADDSVVSRFSVSGDPDLASAASETVLLTIDQPAGLTNHKGGTIAFGPEGFLWLATGDGGGANDPNELAQNPQSLLGKMLRLDVGPVFAPSSIPVAGQLYRIPADNPFVGSPPLDEVWALGLRNPYRWSFDRQTGDLWIADVGQGAREEVDFEPADDPGGRNYGWDVMEGTLCNPNDPAPSPPCNHASLALPIHQYDHSGGRCSITGGYVFRGPVSPLTGLYFFADFCSRQIWTLDPDTLAVVDRSAQLSPAAGTGNIVGFGEDGFGTLHVALADGNVYRILPADPACADAEDNDGDGLVDFPADPGCASGSSAREDPACDDGLDNDADGAFDWDGAGLGPADPQCRGDGWRDRETRPRCGLGFELVLLVPALGGLRRRRARALRRHAGLSTKLVPHGSR